MSHKSVRWAFNFSKWAPSHSEMLLATSCIQLEEKERLARFVFKDDFKASLIGRLMLRKFVHEATQQPYSQVRFSRDGKGKPVVEGVSRSPCNVSHQGHYTVLAGEASALQLGVDVMRIEHRGRDLQEYFRLMARVFTEPEWGAIRGAGDDAAQLGTFCRHWCLKESYLKAIGVGIGVDLRDVQFKIHSDLKEGQLVTDTDCFFKGSKVDFEFQEMLLDSEHCVAVALSSCTNQRVVFKEITFDYLVDRAVPFLDRDENYCCNFFQKLEKN